VLATAAAAQGTDAIVQQIEKLKDENPKIWAKAMSALAMLGRNELEQS